MLQMVVAPKAKETVVAEASMLVFSIISLLFRLLLT